MTNIPPLAPSPIVPEPGPLPSSWNQDDRDTLNSTATKLTVIAALLAILLVVQVLGLVWFNKAHEETLSKLDQIQTGVATQPGNPTTPEPKKK